MEALLDEVVGHGSQVVTIAVITIRLDIGSVGHIGIALAIAGPLDQGGIGEEEEVVAAQGYGLLHEIALAGTFAPIVMGGIGRLEGFDPTLDRPDVTIGLFPRSGTRIDPPQGEPDTLGCPLPVHLLTKEPGSNLFAFCIRPVAAYQGSTPSV